MKKNTGITLIALIITIIILIILTAVTLNNVIGTDLIGFATKAAENYMDAAKEEEEKISELISKGASAVPSTPITPPPATGGIGSSEVANGLKEYQGEYVDIGLDINDSKKEDGTVDTTNDWEIFYATEDRIFLIAADYVPVTKLTEWGVIGDNSGKLDGNGFKKYSSDSYKYSVYWPSGPTTFLDLPEEPSNFSDIVMHNGYNLKTNDAKPNSIAVSHLLNTTAWNGIKEAAGKKDSIEFVIGGPTLEMWCAAWNKAVAGDANGFVTIESDPKTDGTGYNVKHDTTSSTYLYMNGTTSSLGDKLSTLGSSYPLFFPHTTSIDNCYGYWLASPSANDDDNLMDVLNSGSVGYGYYDYYYYGVRPVVSLASGVSLTYNAEAEVYTLS